MVYKLVKTRDRRTKYISDMHFINSLEGQILTVGSDIMLRWLTDFEGLLNTENTRKTNSKWFGQSTNRHIQ